jgi:hypothetical protein
MAKKVLEHSKEIKIVNDRVEALYSSAAKTVKFF